MSRSHHYICHELLIELLAPVGFEIKAVSNGREAIKLYQSWSPHLIWMDLRMPVMDGYEATRQIKALSKEEPPIIIALTGSAFEEERFTALAKGFDDFMRKPFRNESLSKSQSQLKQFLEAVPVGISVHDVTGQIYFSNHTAKVLFGIEKNPDATIDRLSSIYQVYQAGTERLYPAEQLPIVRSLQGEKVKADDLELHQSEGIIPLEVISTPIFDQAQRIIYAIAAFTDITERQQAKQLLEDYNQMLEQQVAERTLELKQEIIERKKAGDKETGKTQAPRSPSHPVTQSPSPPVTPHLYL
jgi:CheY-like chemotaxis protein